jgi:hypothetical protein
LTRLISTDEPRRKLRPAPAGDLSVERLVRYVDAAA